MKLTAGDQQDHDMHLHTAQHDLAQHGMAQHSTAQHIWPSAAKHDMARQPGIFDALSSSVDCCTSVHNCPLAVAYGPKAENAMAWSHAAYSICAPRTDCCNAFAAEH